MQFWLDCWCGSSSLADYYPELFRISCSKGASVADLMRFTNGVLHWEILFCRDVHNRELEAFWSFINSICCTPVRGFGEDKRCWLPCKSKGFIVSAYYHLLVGHSEQFFPWKSIWKQKIPSRVAFFVWTAALGKCLTIGNLRKRKVCILDWCYMCNCNCVYVLTIFSFIARLLWSCGIWCLVYLEFIGYAFVCRWTMCLLVDLVSIVMEIYGWLFLIVCCGASGWREIVGALKTSSAPCLTSAPIF